MLHFGIWEFDANFGLVGRLENLPEVYVSIAKLWETEEKNNFHVWKWPIYFTQETWFTPRIADDFNKAFFYAQNYFMNQQPDNLDYSADFDTRTIQLQNQILRDYCLDNEAEIVCGE